MNYRSFSKKLGKFLPQKRAFFSLDASYSRIVLI